MPHDHSHAHDALAPEPADLGPAFRLAVWLNVAYVLIEAGAGFALGSLALLADAAHNLTDVAGLLIAWGAAVLAGRAGTARFTWGFGRATIYAAALNAAAILIGVGAVTVEALGRLADPVALAGGWVAAVAGIGIVVNTGSALLFWRARRGDLNADGAFRHMAADAAVSAAVVLAAVAIAFTGWNWLDPAVAIAVSALIGWTAWALLRAAARLGLDGVPAGIDPDAVARAIAEAPEVDGVHDLHIWALSTTRTALAAHVVTRPGAATDTLTASLAAMLRTRFGIHHTTLQLEHHACAGGCPGRAA